MKFVYALLIILLITFISSFSMQAVAQGNFAATVSTMKANQQSNKQQVPVRNAKQAAQLAQSRFGGKVLNVKAQASGYKVKLIKKNGYIITVYVDAKSGQISGR